jgi:hypothetical protein
MEKLQLRNQVIKIAITLAEYQSEFKNKKVQRQIEK